VTRPAFWEVTSVPDIRRQCEALATYLGARLASMASALDGFASRRAVVPPVSADNGHAREVTLLPSQPVGAE